MGKGKAPPPAPDGSPPAYDTGSKPRKSVKFTEDVVEKEHSTIRKTVYQPAPPDEVPKSAIKVGLPSGQGPGGGPRPSQTSMRESKKENVEPWDKAIIEPAITDFALPDPWPHRWRIFWHHVFTVVFFVFSMASVVAQYVSSAMIGAMLNTSFTHDTGPCKMEQHGSAIMFHNSQMVFWVLLVPEFWCFLYAFYFITFKKADRPSWSQFFIILIVEFLYTAGMGVFLFIVAPEVSRTMTIAMLLFPTIMPIIMLIFAPTEESSFCLGCGPTTRKIIMYFLRFSLLILWCVGVFLFFFGIEDPVIAIVAIICVVLMSLINWVNFALCSGSKKILSLSEKVRGISKYKDCLTGLPQNADLSLIVAYFGVTPFRIAAIVGCWYFYTFANNLEDNPLMSNQDWNEYERNCDCNSFDDFWNHKSPKCFTTWVWVFGISSAVTSYFQKVSVRVDLQIAGFAIPGIVGPIIALVGVAIADMMKESANDENFSVSVEHIVPLVIGAVGALSFGFLTHYIWHPESWIYPLERDVFMLPSYRPVGTSTFTLLNRRTVDIEAELQSEAMKKFQPDRKSRSTRMTMSRKSARTTTVKGSAPTSGKKTTLWDKGQEFPMIFICTTLWHEEDFEMATLLRSVSKLLRHARRKERNNDPNQYHLEMHIFFDNVFETKKADKDGPDDFLNAPEWLELNDWVKQFQRVFKEVLNIYGDGTYLSPNQLKDGKIIRTPYGGRVVYEIAGYPFVIHLKDANLVQRGKRWSQVMYLYYLIGWKIDACRQKTPFSKKTIDKKKSFILALDGDVDFDPPAFELVLDRCMRNDKLAACCGAIHPKGSGWLVAYQNFEYAVGHWLQKSAEHVLGCVLCSPGCFSLMRVSYLNNPNVMAMYKSLAQNPMEKLQYDQGEDRWLCTLMLFSGGRIEYEGSSHCNTYAPEDLGTFYKQRRRWGPSTTANIWNLVAEQKMARKSNPYISVPYIMYQFTVLVFSLIGVSTTMMMVAEALALGLGGALPRWATYLIVITPVTIFTFACYISKDGELQLSLATWFSLMFSFLMALVLIGIIIEGVNCPLSPSFLFFAAMAFIHIFGALLHGDIYAIICGVIYFLFIPSCFIFLQIYSIANLNDCSWGTRQAKKADTGIKKTFWQRLCGKSDDEIAKENAGDVDGTNCTCVLCLDPRYEIRIKDEVLDMMKNHGKPVVEEQPAPSQPPPPPPAPEPVEKAEPRLTTASVASKGTFLAVDQETRNTINDFLNGDSAVPQSMLEHSGFMGARQTAIIGDETGMNAQYLDPREFDKEIKNERLYGGFQIRKLRQIGADDWQSYMINPKTGKTCYQAKPIGYSEEYTLGDVRDREIKLYKEVGGTNYLSWIIGKNAPFDKRCKVYTLSNPEQTFWETMQDPTEGYIGIRNKGKNFQKIKEHEAWLAEEMSNFRDEKFMYYIFINVMWIIISCVILKYSYMLMSIEIPLGDISLPGCGEVIEDESPDEFMRMRGAYFKMIPTNRSRSMAEPSFKDIGIGFPDYGNGNSDDDDQRVLVLQPFSLFFLFIYIVIIFVQFGCMLWHRLSTLYHYIAYIDVKIEKSLAEDQLELKENIIQKHRQEMDRMLEESEFDDDDDEDYDDDFLDADDDEFGMLVEQTNEFKSPYEEPDDESDENSTKNVTGVGVAAATVAVNFSGDGGGGQDSIRSNKQKKRVTGVAVAAKGLLSVPDEDEQGLISNQSAFTNYESIKNPYEQMEADRAQGKSNSAFDGGEVEMQNLTPTGSDKGENEERMEDEENGHISIPPMIQMSMEDKIQQDEDFNAQNPYHSPGGTAFYSGEHQQLEEPPIPPMPIGVSNPKDWVDFMDPAEIRRKVEADKLEVQRKLEEFSAMMLAKDTVKAEPEANSAPADMITGDPTMEDPDDFDYLMRSSSNSVMAESDSPQKNGIRAASPSNIMNPFEIPGMPGEQDA